MGLVLTPKTKEVKFANSVDPDQMAHDEPSHLDLLCLPSSLSVLDTIFLWLNTEFSPFQNNPKKFRSIL